MSTFIGGVIVAFIKGWKLTLVILSVSPLIFVTSVMFAKLAETLTTGELKSYARAGVRKHIKNKLITFLLNFYFF